MEQNIDIARKLINAGKIADFNLELNKIAENMPTVMDANYTLAKMYFALGDYDKTIFHAVKEASLFPFNTKINNLLDLLLHNQPELEKFLFRFREKTSDAFIFRSVVFENEYKLPEHFSKKDIIIDVGSHIGSFTYAVLKREAGKIYAVEADKLNYSQGFSNLKNFIDLKRVFPLWGASWRSDINDRPLQFMGYSNEAVWINTAGGSVGYQGNGKIIPTIPFDDIVIEASEGGTHRIRLLKIDCEGGEWPSLLTSKRLNLIDEMCGEYHETENICLPPIRYNNSTKMVIENLCRFLEENGFLCLYGRVIETDGNSFRGPFFAIRVDLGAKRINEFLCRIGTKFSST